MRVVNLIYFLPNGNNVSEIMDERLDINPKSVEMIKDNGHNYGGRDTLMEAAE
jgi:hypothetical protein